MKITNPATGAVLADVAADNAAAVRRKYEVARAGHARWAKVPMRKRLDAIFRKRAKDFVIIATGDHCFHSNDATRHQIPRRIGQRDRGHIDHGGYAGYAQAP